MDLLQVLQVIVLAIVQGLAELLPVSSSAHVIVAARLMGYDFGSDDKHVTQWAFLLIMLHTGTMFAVLIYFWSRWKPLLKQLPALIVATAVTGIIGFGLKLLIEAATGQPLENLFHNLLLIGISLAAVAPLILIAGRKDRLSPGVDVQVDSKRAALVGLVQGLALPFRGFSRSGSTISTGMLLGIARMRAEEFSFALAVLLTPPLIAYEGFKLHKQHAADIQAGSLVPLLLPSLLGMCFSFAAGLLALRWLSRWLEKGKWICFGYYCLAAAVVVLTVHYGMPLRQ